MFRLIGTDSNAFPEAMKLKRNLFQLIASNICIINFPNAELFDAFGRLAAECENTHDSISSDFRYSVVHVHRAHTDRQI